MAPAVHRCDVLEGKILRWLLFGEKERAEVTLNSIGDAVMSTDVGGCVTYLNIVAERMTGWSRGEAAGHPFEEVFRIVDAHTREAIQNPMALAIRENKTVGLTPNCILIRRDGTIALRTEGWDKAANLDTQISKLLAAE